MVGSVYISIMYQFCSYLVPPLGADSLPVTSQLRATPESDTVFDKSGGTPIVLELRAATAVKIGQIVDLSYIYDDS